METQLNNHVAATEAEFSFVKYSVQLFFHAHVMYDLYGVINNLESTGINPKYNSHQVNIDIFYEKKLV